MSNIVYSSSELAAYYSSNRNSWSGIYSSEKQAFRHAAAQKGTLGNVLDVGCGAGGLCLALGEQGLITGYTGVDIHAGAIAFARTVNSYTVDTQFIAADILQTELPHDQYDTVVSLSCADWNLETNAIIERCWSLVTPGGNFILTLRLSNQATIRDFARSFQHIFFGDSLPADTSDLEKAPYVVLNIQDALKELASLTPASDSLYGYGYWGTPSPTAVTPYNRLMFAALALHKPTHKTNEPARAELHFPADVFFQD